MPCSTKYRVIGQIVTLSWLINRFDPVVDIVVAFVVAGVVIDGDVVGRFMSSSPESRPADATGVIVENRSRHRRLAASASATMDETESQDAEKANVHPASFCFQYYTASRTFQ
jgi:hypothetical protein